MYKNKILCIVLLLLVFVNISNVCTAIAIDKLNIMSEPIIVPNIDYYGPTVNGYFKLIII